MKIPNDKPLIRNPQVVPASTVSKSRSPQTKLFMQWAAGSRSHLYPIISMEPNFCDEDQFLASGSLLLIKT